MADNERVILEMRLTAGAGTDDTLYLVNPHPYAVQLKNVYIASHNALTANATNYTTIELKKSSTAVMTARATTSSGFTAGQVQAQTVAAAGASLVLAQGEAFALSKTDSGTGVAADISLVCSCEPVRTA